MEGTGELRARLEIVAAAALFSTGGVAIKACQMTEWQVSSFRSGIGALAMLWFVPAARRRPRLLTIGVGVAYAATLTLYALANKATTAANAIFLQSTAPLWVLLLGPILLAQRIRGRDLVVVGLLGGGLAAILLGEDPVQATAPAPVLGNLFATAAGLSWGLTVMGLRRLQETGDGAPAVVVGNGIAFLVGLGPALPLGGPSLADWGWILYLGVFQVGLAYVFLTSGVRSVPAFEASLLLLVEPILSPFWTWIVHGEIPSPTSVLGGAVILGVTTGRTWWVLRGPGRAGPDRSSLGRPGTGGGGGSSPG